MAEVCFARCSKQKLIFFSPVESNVEIRYVNLIDDQNHVALVQRELTELHFQVLLIRPLGSGADLSSDLP